MFYKNNNSKLSIENVSMLVRVSGYKHQGQIDLPVRVSVYPGSQI